jgi:NodT family efflux transporter outer membrane factor (OMF) lipoprotein
MSMRPNRFSVVLAVAVVSACTVGPDYQRPPVVVPASYKEEGWKVGEPRDAIDRGAWWSIYDDPVLDGLERQIDVSSQTLRASEAAYRQAQAIVAEARAQFFPTVDATASATRSGTGGRSVSTGGNGARTLYDLNTTASWDLDLWGRIHRLVEGDIASAQASAADLASARLSVQAALATDYFSLRIDDELKRLLDDTVVSFTRSLTITQNQYRVGVAAASDVALARAQVQGTQAQAINVGVQRAQLEHAIAVLVGKPAPDFSIAIAPRLATRVPSIPPGMPSTLLERRPDIAAAERLMASANAQIGVAVAAFYPDLTLSASFGFQGFNFGSLLQAANKVWSVGPQLAETVFDGGLRTAQVEQFRAAYDQTVANHRQTVLLGFQQVEDELAALRILVQQAEVQDQAVKSAQEAERLILNQYLAGTVAYTSVVTVQVTALADEENALTIYQNRLTASVALINALGGGWNSSQLPSDTQVKAGGMRDAGTEAAATAAIP